MSPGLLLAVAAALLIAPWLLMPARGAESELRGVLRVLWWIIQLFCAGWHRLEAGDSSSIPERGPALLIANHTCGLDPLVLQAGTRRVLSFVIAQEQYDHWLLHPFCRRVRCIPVRRDGRDFAAARAALRALKEGRVVPIFPEGRIIPTSGRELGEGKTGVAFLALRADVPVIPAYIWGTPPTNIIWKGVLTPSNARVLFGPPVDLSDIPADQAGDKAVLAEVTDRLMGAIAALREEARAREDDRETAGPSDEPRRPERGAGGLPGGIAAARPA